MEPATEPNVVIAVDLDGSLTLTDTLHESVLQLVRDHPLLLLRLPLWLAGGKARFKSLVASHVDLDAAILPYHQPLLDYLRERKAAGRKLVLCSATNMRIAHAVADHLQLFDDVIASDDATNNKGVSKRQALEARYGPQGYDYVGNSIADIEVWRGAREAIVVNAPQALVARARAVTNVGKIFPANGISLSELRRMFRVHQWLKNLLVFVPLLAAHQIGDVPSLMATILAFIAFSLSASAVYIINDLLDLESDRRHPRKRHRPFASGVAPIHYGVVMVPALVLASAAMALWIGQTFAAWLAAYLVLTSLYSVALKRYALVDCLTLAALYTLRIIAGAVATDIPLSFWLLAFSVFIFLSLAFVKRYAELQVQQAAGNTRAHGRGYSVADAPLVQTLGIASGYAAVLVLALYLQGETATTLYQQPELIWFAVPLMLYWVSWVWLAAHRGQMHDDPIVFAVKDKASLITASLLALLFVVATVGVARS